MQTDIWDDYWRRDHMLVAEIGGLIVQLKMIPMEEYITLTDEPTVPCYALRNLFDHKRDVCFDLLSLQEMRQDGIKDSPGWGVEFQEQKRKVAEFLQKQPTPGARKYQAQKMCVDPLTGHAACAKKDDDDMAVQDA